MAFIKTNDYPGTLKGEFKQRQLRIAARTILETRGTPTLNARAPQTYVPGPAVTAIRKETGLTLDQLKTALAGEGTDKQRCDTRIAVIKAAFALPRAQQLTLLREM